MNLADEETGHQLAAANCHAQLCKILISLGLGNGSVSGMSRYLKKLSTGAGRSDLISTRDPILSLVGCCTKDSSTLTPETHLDTLRVMIQDGQYDPMEHNGSTTAMHSCEGPSASYQWLFDQDESCIDFEDALTVGYNTIAAAQIISDESNTSEDLSAVLAR
jgi:hypothetical protein